jgi:signal transduction histidine kinase
MTRLQLILLAAGGAAGVAAEWVAFGWSNPGHWIPDLAVGLCLVGCGLVASARRPASRSGMLMSATGFSWFLGNLAGVGSEAVAWVAAHGLYLYRGPLLHLVLTYPNGRASSRLTRTAVTIAYATAIITPLWGNAVVTILLATCLLAVSALQYVRAVGPARRAGAFALWAAAGLSSVLAGTAAARLVLPSGEVDLALLLVYEASLCVIAAGLCAGLLVAPWERAPVTDLVVQLGRARSWTLRGELSSVLGDPMLQVGYWVADAGGFVDTEGRALPLPEAGSERSATLIERDGQAVAVLIHDSALMDDPALLEAVTTAARLVASNARLQAEVQARIVQLAASRRRILEAGDEERRRLERRLHDGAERRARELGEALRRGRLTAPAPMTREAIARAEDQLTRTLEELRRLARGLHPRALAERGLEGALGLLAEGLPVPVEIEMTSNMLSPRVEAAVYFVCSEGLANVAKYASASQAVVRVTAGTALVRVVVEDDGVGGADPARGSGLRGLADRVETLGGQLRVESRPGAGTRLAAEIPLGGEAPEGVSRPPGGPG